MLIMKRLLQCLFSLFIYTGFAQTGTLQKYIVVDQFGYRPGDDKVAVIADPQQGFNAGDSFTPGNTYQVRRLSNDNVVLEGSPVQWNNGATDPDNGDRGWWFDFSLLDQTGDFYIYDVQKNRRSHVFHVSENVYEDVLKTAMRTYYYQRLSDTGNNITKSFGDDPWKFSGRFRKQDNAARDANNQIASTARDMSGGWMDAGDSNKYVTFAATAVHDLLTSYRENKAMWDNLDLDIPESNNTIPDILDEIKWELDWVLRMQDADGGVFIKIGQIGQNHPDVFNDASGAFYEKKCSSSTVAAAAMYAHGAKVFRSIGENTYANTLQQAAINAWNWFVDPDGNNREIQIDCDPKLVRSGDADGGSGPDTIDDRRAAHHGNIVAATVWLWEITGNNTYHNEFLNYYDTEPSMYVNFKPTEWGMYQTYASDALEYYLGLNNANSGAKSIINAARSQAVANPKFVITSNENLYRFKNTQNHWGNTKPAANMGNSALAFSKTGANNANNKLFKKRALNILHGFHGVNALQMAYLTNMKSSSRIRWGAESSINAIFHTMFKDGSNYDNTQENNGPVPGYLTGGPTTQWISAFSWPEIPGDPSPYKVQLGTRVYNAFMVDQPKDKLYTENTDAYDEQRNQLMWPYVLNENSITYQSAYVKLLANFVGRNSGSPVPDDDEIGISNDLSANLPQDLEIGADNDLSFTYTATKNGTIFVSLLDASSEDGWSGIDGAEAQVNINAGSGTATVTLPVPANLTPGPDYALYINLFDREFNNTLASYPTDKIALVANTGGGNNNDDGDIVIRAKGVCGSERMELRVDGSVVKTWGNISTTFSNYNYSGFSGGDIEVVFTNDYPNNTACDRNFTLDNITVCGTTYETEDNATRENTSGTEDTLWSNGYFDFGTRSCNGTDSTGTTYYYIRNKQLNDYLRPANANNDARILVQDKDNSDWFKWEKVATGNGHFYLKNKASGKYFRPADNVDVKTNGSVMQQKSTAWSGSYTQWREVDSGDGTYVHLANRQTGLYFRALGNTDRYLIARPASWTGSWTRWSFEPVSSNLKADLTAGESAILLYPNPAKNILFLANAKDNISYSIYDLSGRVVKSGTFSDNAKTGIDITTLETGLYLLSTPEKTFKFIKE